MCDKPSKCETDQIKLVLLNATNKKKRGRLNPSKSSSTVIFDIELTYELHEIVVHSVVLEFIFGMKTYINSTY